MVKTEKRSLYIWSRMVKNLLTCFDVQFGKRWHSATLFLKSGVWFSTNEMPKTAWNLFRALEVIKHIYPQAFFIILSCVIYPPIYFLTCVTGTVYLPHLKFESTLIPSFHQISSDSKEAASKVTGGKCAFNKGRELHGCRGSKNYS